MQCPNCGSDNRAGAKFCDECATPLPLTCPACGIENRPGAKFCNECATPLTNQSSVQRPASSVQTPLHPIPYTLYPTPSPQPPATYTPKHLAERILAEQAALEARGAPDGERKTITALFADIKGSTALIEDLDPEDARRIIDPALKLMMDAVHRYEGYVAQALGDGIFALFGAPIAHEDHAQRALYAALLMQEEGKKQAEKLRLEQGVNIQIRIGINTGEVVVRSIRKDDLHTDYVPIGHSTNLAARMENLATPGSIVVSEHTHKLTAGYFEFQPLGAAQVKGATAPIQIYEVTGVGPLRTRLQVAARRGLARFVGRQREMEHLQQVLRQTQAGHGQIVGVIGEAGVGKSRLFYEFVGAQHAVSLHVQHDCLVLETFSVAHDKAYPYLPLIDLLKTYFQLTPRDDERKRREKLTGKVLTLDRSLADILPYLFSLLGLAEPTTPLPQMDPQLQRRRMMEAIKRLLVRESLNQPVILVVEDLHWLDSETQAFLSVLSESIASSKILLLVNYRPEYQHTWGNKTYYTQLRLDPLGKEAAEELLLALLEEKVGTQDAVPLRQFILTKTEGNPFFMEEIVQALHEQGVLARLTAIGTTGQSPLLTDLHLPPTVQAVLASRIDRLPAQEKEFLQTLSVIGKEFPLSLLKQVVDQSENTLQQLLASLREAEFIYEQPAFPEPEYIFKHALTQEVAYNSLLLERRQILHEWTAKAIEEVFHSRLEDHYGELAHQYSRSGNTGKAVEYLHLAGQWEVRRSSHPAAISHFTAALELLKTVPATPQCAQQELTLQLALAAALQATQGPASSEVEHAYTRARALCQQVGETPQLFSVLRGLWVLHHVRADLPRARELGTQLLSMAEQTQDTALLLESHRALGSTLLWQGEFPLARVHLEQGAALYDAKQHRTLAFLHGGADPGVSCLCDAARVLWFLGFPAQALQRSLAALALARDVSDPFSLAYALVFAAGIHQLRREGRETQEQAEAGMVLAREHGFSSLLSAGTIRRGWALAEQGRPEEGLAQMHQGLTARRTAGAGLANPYFFALQAEVYGTIGQTEQALALLNEALAAIYATGEYRLEAEVYRLKGQLMLQQSSVRRLASSVHNPQSAIRNPQSEAEACFQKAIEIARRQSAKSLELRAVMSLARLWQAQSKQEAARQRLAEIYDWFTEGFDTKDLQDAKALLAAFENQKPGH